MKHIKTNYIEFINESSDNKPLVDRIYKFIDKYAAISPNWDGIEDDEKYTCPDVYTLIMCAKQLEQGVKPYMCNSDWGCGGYKPYTSKEGKEEHDAIVSEVYKLIR